MKKYCPRFHDMYGIKRVLADALDGKAGIRSTDNDRVYAITGAERKGKSHLSLNIFDYWYVDLLNVKDYGEQFIEFFAANKKEFVTALVKASKFYMVNHDEALKDLYARDAISQFNKDLNKAYYIIGGKNLATLLNVQSILDLDPNFRKRRVTGMFHVYARGKVAYYGKKKISQIIPALMRMSIGNARPDPKICRDLNGKLILPDFTDTFPKYNGPLLKRYLERKNSNMDGTVQNLFDKYGDEEKEEDKRPIHEQLLPEVQALVATGKLTRKQMAEKLSCSPRTLARSLQLLRKSNPALF